MEYTNEVNTVNYKEVVNNDVLYVSETVVSIKTNIDFRAIVIKHNNDFSCYTLLSNNFLFKKTDNKILIMKLNIAPPFAALLFSNLHHSTVKYFVWYA